jgi:hypothetical protein
MLAGWFIAKFGKPAVIHVDAIIERSAICPGSFAGDVFLHFPENCGA